MDFAKSDGLIPAVIQDAQTFQVLMLGYMNEEALTKTREEGVVTFYSRSKQRLWTKGESSGNFMKVQQIVEDCDKDTLLIFVEPSGPACHTGSISCFAEDEIADLRFLGTLERIIAKRFESDDPKSSYTARLKSEGLKKIAQKVGEEGVEVTIAAISEDDKALKGEISDLLYHLLVLCKERGLSISTIMRTLAERDATR